MTAHSEIPTDEDLRLDVRMPQFERWLVTEAIRRTSSRKAAARALGISERSLYNKLAYWKLDGAMHIPYRRVHRVPKGGSASLRGCASLTQSDHLKEGTMGSTGGSTTTTTNIDEQQAQRIGRDVRDRVSRDLEQKFQSKGGTTLNINEVREVLQQVDFPKHIRESLQQEASTMSREPSASRT